MTVAKIFSSRRHTTAYHPYPTYPTNHQTKSAPVAARHLTIHPKIQCHKSSYPNPRCPPPNNPSFPLLLSHRLRSYHSHSQAPIVVLASPQPTTVMTSITQFLSFRIAGIWDQFVRAGARAMWESYVRMNLYSKSIPHFYRFPRLKGN
jgi:hypothetical protein